MSRFKNTVLIKHLEYDTKEESRQEQLRNAYHVESNDFTIKESGIYDVLIKIAKFISYLLLIFLALIGLLVLLTPYLRYLLLEEIAHMRSIVHIMP